MKRNTTNKLKIKWESFKFLKNAPDLSRLVKYAFDFNEANTLAMNNGIELRFTGQEDFENFLIQVYEARLYENKR